VIFENGKNIYFSTTNIDTLVPSLCQGVETRNIEFFFCCLSHFRTWSAIVCDFRKSSREFLYLVVNGFTQQTLPAVNRKHFFMSILCLDFFCPQRRTTERCSSAIHSSSTVVILTTETIPEVSSFKYLGIVIRSDLSWADHVNYTLRKAWKALHLIMRILRQGNNNTKRLAYATVKFHKPDIPIRPIINWRKAPGYKLAKYLTKLLHNRLDLLYAYNVCNSAHLMTDLNTIQLNSNTRICSFDIENMYRNILRKEVINITNNILENNVEIK
jgi:hypothetical protein